MAALRARWEQAGRPGRFEAVLGCRLLCVSVGVVVGSLGCLFDTRLGLLAPPVILAGLRLPEMTLARWAGHRRSAITQHVPDLVELLVSTTEAGLNPLIAFQRAADVLGGPLGDELRATARQIELGLPWRTSLEQLAARTEAPSLRRLVVALSRSSRLGTAVGSTLRSVAADLRSDRRTRAEELARRAPIKMLFPLVFLILPAFLLLTVGPVVLSTLHSLH
jgi:tight adherence protein C